MRYYCPYPGISGTIQKNRLFIAGYRDNIVIKFDDSLRKKVILALSQWQNPSHGPEIQWLMSRMVHAPLGFVSRAFLKRPNYVDTKPELWNFAEATKKYYGRQWRILFDPVPFYTWFRYQLENFSFSEEILSNLLLQDSKLFMKMAKFLFAQSKYLAKKADDCLNETSLSSGMEEQLIEIQAYYLTVADSVAALELGKDWQQFIIPQIRDLGETFTRSVNEKDICRFFLLEIVKRLIFLDDHPVKTLLHKMLAIRLFQKDYVTIDLESTQTINSVYSDLGHRPVSYSRGSHLVHEMKAHLDNFFKNQSLLLDKVKLEA